MAAVICFLMVGSQKRLEEVVAEVLRAENDASQEVSADDLAVFDLSLSFPPG